MTFIARLHPFLIIALLIVAIFVTGLFWEAPFHADPQGLTETFRRVWDVAFLPIRLALDRLQAAGVDTTRTITIVVLASYAAVLVLLDIIVTKVARKIAG